MLTARTHLTMRGWEADPGVAGETRLVTSDDVLYRRDLVGPGRPKKGRHDSWHPEVKVQRRLVEVVRVEIPVLDHLDKSIEVMALVFLVEIRQVSSDQGISEPET